jgi:hypothetical protein
MAFRARELREGTPLDELRREINAIQKELERELVTLRVSSPVTSLVTDATYSANYGQIVRLAPPSTGQRLILPAPNLSVPNGKVVAVVEAASGVLSVEAVDSTVNGSTTLTYLAGIGTVEFVLTPTGWYGWSVTLVDMAALAGAGLSFAAGAFAVNGSTSITVTSDEVRRAALTGFVDAAANANATTSAEPLVTYSASGNMSAERVTTSSTSVTVSTATPSQIEFQRAALTGEATASANANAVTVTRSTDYQASPWTGNHQFNGEVRLGTLHTQSNVSGAFNITLAAGASRIVITSTGAATLGTISGAADGRLVVLEHVRASGAGDLTLSHAVTADGIACPGSVNLVLTGDRSGCVLVSRGTTWRVHAHTN